MNAEGRLSVTFNKSIDGGRTFSQAQEIESQGRFDLVSLAIGPDPAQRRRDNVYLAWPSFDATITTAVLRFARSTDGGATFATKTVFAPPPDPDNPGNPQAQLQFPSVAVDKLTGKIYIALLNFGFVNDDYLRILVSEDGGETFQSLRFGIAGAPNPEVFPVVQPGSLVECGSFPNGAPHAELALHAGDDIGGSRTGLPRYVNASRLFLRPTLAVSKGVIHLAWSQATSGVFGDPDSGADILYIRSDNDGESWTSPLVVNQHSDPAERSVMPEIEIGRFPGETALPFLPSPGDVHIGYYTQRADGLMMVNLAHSRDRGASFPAELRRQLSSTPFALAPSNIPLPTEADPFQTTHYNRLKRTCTSLGDYMGLATGFGVLHAAWGDSRNVMRQPENPFDPISGQQHPKEDVFYSAPWIR